MLLAGWDEGKSRFPENDKFVECRLWLMTTKGAEPDVPLALRLADTLIQRTPESKREFQPHNSQMIVAAILARAGLKDSARHVAVRARSTPASSTPLETSSLLAPSPIL